mmetsp:Transcript_5675/g.10144  ORF Transcript_5675/g.10144 Transcript_5675/m.10144 type:complete len:204 (+) Transcript_5675:70-681(+)
MVRRDGGAHGVWHTNETLHFCRCGMCLRQQREALLKPENAGKTVKQLVHEGQWGHQRGNNDAAGAGSQQPGWRRMQKTDAHAETVAAMEILQSDHSTAEDVDPSYVEKAVRTATLGDVAFATTASLRMIHHARPSEWTAIPLAPRPVTPVAVSWPHAPTTPSGIAPRLSTATGTLPGRQVVDRSMHAKGALEGAATEKEWVLV